MLSEYHILREEQHSLLSEEELRNAREAAVCRLYEKALAGDGDAQCVIGLLFEEGIGVRKSMPNAVHFYKMGSDAGHGTAECIMVDHINYYCWCCYRSLLVYRV